MKTTYQMLFILTLLALPLTGCGEKLPAGMPRPVPCEIIVMQEGQPLADALVTLQPTDGSTWTAMGNTDASGKAIVYTIDRYVGAIPGKHKVIVNKTQVEEPTLSSSQIERLIEQGMRIPYNTFTLVEKQYGDASTTTLEIEVTKRTRTHTVDVGKAVRDKFVE